FMGTAYWGVSQNKTFGQDREGGYLWAPTRGSGGVVFHHCSTMTLVQPGEVIFSYAQKSIGAIGMASTPAYDAPQPVEFEGGWQDDGRRVDLLYQPIQPATPISTFVDELVELLPER